MMDQLSDLSNGILHQIFSWMPTEEVVKTSVLSKRWNRLWLSSLDLYFDDDLRPQINDFIEFVNRTLIFCGNVKVKSFRIDLYMNIDYTRHLDLWIRYALQNEAEHLLLNFHGDDEFYMLPQFCYFSSSLTSLTIKMCRVQLKKGVGWTSLKTLVLKYVIFGREDVINQVLLGCPQLESLELSYCIGCDVLSIYSNTLKRLVIIDTVKLYEKSGLDLKILAPSLESICISGDLYRKCLLIFLSSLLHATLDFSIRTKFFYVELARLLQVLESLEHVKNLKLGIWCIKVLGMTEKEGLSCRLLKCKCLTLNTSLKQEDIPGILLLLKCSPDLEKLTLNLTSPENEQFLYESEVGKLAECCNVTGDCCLNSQVDGISCLQFKLRTINFTRFVDQNLVLPFIRFMLKEARVLMNMEIRSKYLGPCSPLDSFFGVAQELLDMTKSSPNVVVKLHNSNGKDGSPKLKFWISLTRLCTRQAEHNKNSYYGNSSSMQMVSPIIHPSNLLTTTLMGVSPTTSATDPVAAQNTPGSMYPHSQHGSMNHGFGAHQTSHMSIGPRGH